MSLSIPSLSKMIGGQYQFNVATPTRLNAHSCFSLTAALMNCTLICTVTTACVTQTSSYRVTIHVSGTVTLLQAPTSKVPGWTGSGTVCTHVAWFTLYKRFLISNYSTWLVSKGIDILKKIIGTTQTDFTYSRLHEELLIDVTCII